MVEDTEWRVGGWVGGPFIRGAPFMTALGHEWAATGARGQPTTPNRRPINTFNPLIEKHETNRALGNARTIDT